MIGLDTNILVRYLTQDDPGQSLRATRLIERTLSERNPGFITLVVLVETCWVLMRLYDATPDEVRVTVCDFLDARQLIVEHRLAVARAIQHLGKGAGDFADALIAECAAQAGCERTVTFDKSAAKLGMTLL
ncbi:MAG: PIN domain-containing protein [Burkholderiales bacterium]